MGCRALAASLLLACSAAPAAVIEQRLDLRLASERSVKAVIRAPDHAETRMPAVMLFGGFERGAAALDLVQQSRPTVLATIEYPIDVPRKIGWQRAVGLLPEARRAIHDSFEAIGLLHAQLRARPDVDPARVSIVGVSFGAPFAVVSAAEHGISGLVVIHGFANVPEVITHQFAWRWAEDGRGWMQPLAWALGRFLNWYAEIPRIEVHAARLHAGQKVWMLSANDDALIPPRADAALREGFAASQATFEHETEAGGHLRGDKDPRIPELLRRTEHWLIANGL